MKKPAFCREKARKRFYNLIYKTMEQKNVISTEEPKVVKVHKVTGSPFAIVEVKEADATRCLVVIGNSVMSEKNFTDVKDAKAYVRQKPWELIINASCYIMEQSKKIAQYEEKDKKGA